MSVDGQLHLDGLLGGIGIGSRTPDWGRQLTERLVSDQQLLLPRLSINRQQKQRRRQQQIK